MYGEDGKVLDDKEVMKSGLDHLSEACCFFYEIETPEGKAMSFMCDAALRYAQAIYNDNDPLLSEEFLNSEAESLIGL